MSKKKKVRIYERTTEDDIRFRGPLSYRHLWILGWIAISFKVLSMVIALGVVIDPNQPQWVLNLQTVSMILAEFALPLFLFGNFAVLLDGKRSFKEQLIKFGALSLLVVVLYLLVTEHYLLEVGTAITEDPAMVQKGIEDLLFSMTMEGGLSFNLFLDMFLCTLLLFFLEYDPKRFFTGKKRIIFRCFAILPILYEAGSLAVRIMITYEMIQPSFLIYPFLTTKPILSFVLFVILVFFIKFREFRFLRHGRTKEEFKAFSQTNRHSLHFSVFASVMILITCVMDFILFVILTFVRMGPLEEVVEYTEEMLAENAVRSSAAVAGWGIGKHMAMVVIIPIILLFSYTRTHKNE